MESLLGGRGSGLLNPRALGSRIGAVFVREKPVFLESMGLAGIEVLLSSGNELIACDICCAFGGLGGPFTLSSLLGGVEKGLFRASADGLRGLGCNEVASVTCSEPNGSVAGFAGIFGLSARFIGGGGLPMATRFEGGTTGCEWSN